jgi:hypothetical protein
VMLAISRLIYALQRDKNKDNVLNWNPPLDPS